MLVLDQCPMVTFCSRAQGYAMARDITGFRNLPGGLNFFSGTSIEDTGFGGSS